ncbi:restriction endonuclease subunit S [Myroides sp. mNGS23_01]|nr:restriction endonuclease subunit S [Myroides sp. mNGS23_01]WHT40885.1 restriction endonuclease subunit S [Myroides sp. mNGS23_01]
MKKGDYAYNKGNSKTYEYGCIYTLNDYESALVPFVYICFRPIIDICNDFYSHWFLNHNLDNQLRKIITSGARGDGLLNVSRNDFFNLFIEAPSIEEQNAIAEILNTANQEVKQYQQKLEVLTLQKKA